MEVHSALASASDENRNIKKYAEPSYLHRQP